MPLPNTRVIPDGWEAHHRPVPASASTATITITRPAGAGTWDPDTGDVTNPDPGVVYEGPARVQARTGPENPDAAGQITTIREYLVSVPDASAAPRQGDRVTVTACADQLLLARTLTVLDVVRGSLTWDRPLICSLDASNQG